MKNEDNVLEVFGNDRMGNANERQAAPRTKQGPTHLGGEARVALYMTMAGLIEGGFGMAEAARLISNEHQARGNRIQSQAVGIFFGGIAGLIEAGKIATPEGSTVDAVGDLATRAFGRNFVSTEEMALLRSLLAATDLSAILRTAAAIVSLQHKGVLEVVTLSSMRG